MKIGIPSKGKTQTLRQKVFRLFPDALVCVGEAEVEEQAKTTQYTLTQPMEVVGISPLLQR